MRFPSNSWPITALALVALARGEARAEPPERAPAAPAAPAAPVAAPAASAPKAPAKTPTPAPAAAPAKPVSKAAADASALRAAVDKLGSGDPGVVRQGIDTLTQLGSEAAAQAIAARLGRGLPPQLAEHALEALVQVGKASVAPVLLELVLHRRPQIRSRAIEALGMLRVKSAQSALLYALDDPSAEVREASVRALAQVGSARALPALFTASDRGAAHALVAIGQLATPREVKAIVERAKDGDVTRIKPALDTMLERADFPIAGKLAVVRGVAALGPQSARNHLVQWLDARKTEGDPRLRQALFDAIKRLDQAPGGAQTVVTKNVVLGGTALPVPATTPVTGAKAAGASNAAPASAAAPAHVAPATAAPAAAAPAPAPSPARPQVANADAPAGGPKP
jgi:HEAT repeat protein